MIEKFSVLKCGIDIINDIISCLNFIYINVDFTVPNRQ